MRDWRSAIITVTVRDQRMRQHDPILGVVPLKLSDILQTSSQVTRWYPLDGGIGFGRIRISLLWRSIETRLPPQQLGWDVGTFEFLSDKILAIGYHSNAKLKMRTGGSSGSIGRAQCKKTDEGDGVYWDIATENGRSNVRLPVRYRYRSPVVFEFHTASKRNAVAYAMIWLHHLEDNKEQNFNIPIWKTDNGMRLTQNYITEANFKDIPDIAIEEIGRLQFRGRFKAGTDEDHSNFITDNDSRETQETWEACQAEGVRNEKVTKELPPAVQKLHDESLTQGRDVLSRADEKEKRKWLSKDGTDWSGAFGQDPAQYAAQGGYTNLKTNGHNGNAMEEDEDEDDDEDDGSTSTSDLGIHDAENDDQFDGASIQNNNETTTSSKKSVKHKADKKDLHRKQKGLMQWKPMRNLAFAKEEAKFAVKRTMRKATLQGREPDVETETQA